MMTTPKTYDKLGRLTTLASAAGSGDATGAGLQVSSYTANALNQYTQKTVPGVFDVVGRWPI